MARAEKATSTGPAASNATDGAGPDRPRFAPARPWLNPQRALRAATTAKLARARSIIPILLGAALVFR